MIDAGCRPVLMAHLVLHEPRVPSSFEEVSGVRTTERVEIEPIGESQLLAVAPDPSDQSRLDDQSAAFAGEEVQGARITAAVGEPVLDDAGRPPPDSENAPRLVRRGPLRLAVANLADAERAELSGVWVAGEVDRL